MNKRCIVDLTADERADLLALLGKGVAFARKLTRARILLLADEGRADEEIAAALHVHRVTVERARRRFVEGGMEQALNEQPRPGGMPKLDDKQEAMLMALACSKKGQHSSSFSARSPCSPLRDPCCWASAGVMERPRREQVRKAAAEHPWWQTSQPSACSSLRS